MCAVCIVTLTQGVQHVVTVSSFSVDLNLHVNVQRFVRISCQLNYTLVTVQLKNFKNNLCSIDVLQHINFQRCVAIFVH